MNSRITQAVLAMLLLCLIAPSLFSQPFQRRYAYFPGPAIETGRFHDVECLQFMGPNNENVVAVGRSNIGPPFDGLVAYHDPNGIPLNYIEFQNPFGNPVEAEAITETPTGDLVAIFFDPVANATDVVRLTVGGALVWQVRLQRFHGRGIDSDWAPYPGQEGIWVIGNSTVNNQYAIEALDAFGGQVWAFEYFIADPVFNYPTAMGFQIDYDPFNNNLIGVGAAQIAGFATTAMLATRVNLAGGWVNGRSYLDPTGADFYHGKALEPHPWNPGNYVVSFEYSNNGFPFDKVGVMEINPVGNPLWINNYPGAGFFNGTNYISTGIETDGTQLLTSGYFHSPAYGGGQPSGFSLALDPMGNPLQFNEYETAGFFAPVSTGFWGMDFNNLTNHHYMAGWFDGVGGGTFWPFGPDARSFWMVAAAPPGNSICSFSDATPIIPLGPVIPHLAPNPRLLPKPVNSPLNHLYVQWQWSNQCSWPKRSGEEIALDEAASAVLVTYSAADHAIVVEVVGEASETGLIQVVDLQGRVLHSLSAATGRHRLDASTLSAGIYMVRFDMPGLASGVKKLVIQ